MQYDWSSNMDIMPKLRSFVKKSFILLKKGYILNESIVLSFAQVLKCRFYSQNKKRIFTTPPCSGRIKLS